jgi:Ca2+-binding RTX toxin-like protein
VATGGTFILGDFGSADFGLPGPQDLWGIEDLIGTRGDDSITGDAQHNELQGHDGNDSIDGANGDGTLTGGGDDTLYGGATGDTLWDDGGQDALHGGTEDDQVIVVGGIDGDVFFGGGGVDTADWAASTLNGAVFDLGAGTADDLFSSAGPETMGGFENLIGTAGSDEAIGTAAANRLNAGAGGIDTIDAGDGNDLPEAGSGFGTARLYGGDGADTLDGGTRAGAVLFEGGAGDDTFRIGDTLDQFKDFRGGTGGGDRLVASGLIGHTYVVGQAGHIAFGANRAEFWDIEELRAGDGDDTITGGTGVDDMSGDSGRDTFRFVDVPDSGTLLARDLIRDFRSLFDVLDFAELGIAASTGPLAFIDTAAFSGSTGELRQIVTAGDTLIEIDLDGDATGDFEVLLTGVQGIVVQDWFCRAGLPAGSHPRRRLSARTATTRSTARREATPCSAGTATMCCSGSTASTRSLAVRATTPCSAARATTRFMAAAVPIRCSAAPSATISMPGPAACGSSMAAIPAITSTPATTARRPPIMAALATT